MVKDPRDVRYTFTLKADPGSKLLQVVDVMEHRV